MERGHYCSKTPHGIIIASVHPVTLTSDELQAPHRCRYRIGSIEASVVSDGASRLQFDETFVLNASKAEVNAALTAASLQRDVFINPYHPIVINTGRKLALIDTGRG